MVAVLALEAAVEVSWSHGLTALERICAVWSKYPPVGEMGEDAAEGECPVSMSRREAAVFWVGATLRVRVGGWSGVGWVRGFLYVFWVLGNLSLHCHGIFSSKVDLGVRLSGLSFSLVEMDPDEFFNTSPVPPHLSEASEKVKEFVAKSQKNPLVVITSGGTTVPLERNTVRFIDNFSTGQRGAASAEWFLAQSNYHVIFFTRPQSAQPFARRISGSAGSMQTAFLQSGLRISEDKIEVLDPTGEKRQALQDCLRSSDRLLVVKFESVSDYLHGLRLLSMAVEPKGPLASFFLGAAVSDYFVPPAEMAEHKIDSRAADGLTLTLRNVPKLLGKVREWAPLSFVGGFKLETDLAVLRPKALRSLSTYGLNLVIGNELHTRRHRVTLFLKGGIEEELTVPPDSPEALEPKLAGRFSELHTAFVQSSST
uniref:DNA/pantothenate metabolism flavoprotein C-terminal domain-containing protein n=1 Tax=Chromera velia CCMP2878 TaxID=1169474 RepID=A0A0G4GYH2_9ALVE|eukprot:Cvel_23921.t1-p1 / transcript=Cvel_23921.t1 / gene=Cvel_23921 / organism=Chromera_velia_CCMP2878 / gene_product=Phosphopantothenate--cysteine ligase, putative / transcript_product=Phosphopantothenate--cysteine ligase, putative / location=Cvel_scaffold2524:14803-17321(+) / protein_length=425 / sequence_SO=supercontig / SO=protein_coding / is_pseudo=false